IHITASDVGFDDLAIADKGSAVVVTWAGGSITLEGVDHTALTTEDFVF
ncbi:MAG: calcium-binding protein, partial [Rhodobacteraceae bacterium]|nr:calcium-binding protein [Paracoccaceae bacterium]MBC6437811.1 calcium-binding protein [Paracoccaceae bacterium]